jgi:hypothetical protein
MSNRNEGKARGKKPLLPADRSPWYILMTVYGEQLGGMNEELHLKNRAAWNAWACQNMSLKEREAVAKATGVPLEELSAWAASKEEIQRCFNEAWRNRSPVYQSQIDLPNPSEAPRLMFSEFSNSLIMDRFVFPSGIYFIGSEFAQPVSLQFAILSSETRFDACSFNGHIQFTDANFNGSCGFNDAQFSAFSDFSRSSFKGTLDFNKANLSSTAEFIETSFSDSSFHETVFKGEANFQNSKFSGLATFNRAIFEGQTEFTSASFNAPVFFTGTSFRRRAYFRSVEFRVTTPDNSISFGGSHFEEPTNFESARFFSQFPNLEGTILHSETIFTVEEGDIIGRFWPEHPKNPKTAKNSCSKIRNNLAKQGLPEAEHFFYRREMRFAGLASTNPLEKLAYVLFSTLSDYGYSFVRPLVALVGLFAFGFLAHWGYFLSVAVQAGAGWTAFGLSFANLFPYFQIGRFFDAELARNLPPALKAVGGFQTVSGAILLFLFALGLRTRFRMR